MASRAYAVTHPRATAASAGLTRWWKRWGWAATVAAALIYLPGWVTLQRLSIRQSQLAHELDRLAQDNRRLVQERNQLLTNPQYVEAVARRQMKAARQGEMILKLEPAAAKRPSTKP